MTFEMFLQITESLPAQTLIYMGDPADADDPVPADSQVMTNIEDNELRFETQFDTINALTIGQVRMNVERDPELKNRTVCVYDDSIPFATFWSPLLFLRFDADGIYVQGGEEYNIDDYPDLDPFAPSN